MLRTIKVVLCVFLLASTAVVLCGKEFNVAVASLTAKEGLSWTFLHWLGAKIAQREGLVDNVVDILMTEATAIADLSLLASSGDYQLIVVVGWQFVPAVMQVAAQFPKQYFMMTDITLPQHLPNVLNVLYRQEQPSAVVGALAAALAVAYDMPYVGLVLGREGAVLHEFEMGYKFGVDWALNKLAETMPEVVQGKKIVAKPRQERVLWTYTGSFSDPALGRSATEAQVMQGAGVIYNVAGATGLGIFSFIDDYKRINNIPSHLPPFAIGVDLCQEWLSPNVITSALKRADVAVKQAIKWIQEGVFENIVRENPVMWFSFENGGMGVTTHETLKEFLDYAVAVKVLDEARINEVINNWEKIRAAQPEWVWEIMESMYEAILKGEVELPRPFGDPLRWKIEDLRKYYG
ncbi:MAG: BMP family ABC transporter substrate-binding protein [Candidatus Bathyarchaeia archaeon]